jgi:hypothetical protein
MPLGELVPIFNPVLETSAYIVPCGPVGQNNTDSVHFDKHSQFCYVVNHRAAGPVIEAPRAVFALHTLGLRPRTRRPIEAIMAFVA